MNYISKILFFITSYSPLFLIFLVLDFNYDSDYYFQHPFLSLSIIFITISSMLIVTWLIFYIFKDVVSFNQQGKVKKIDNTNDQILAYLFAYVIPFIWISTDKKLIVISILLIVTFMVFIKSELLKYNIFLLFLGFDITKVTTEDWVDFFLIKKSNTDIKNKIIVYWEISKNLYLLKK